MERKTIRVHESSNLAHNYSKYRPTYPQQLWEKIFDFTNKHGADNNLVLDLACGSGQSTFELCGRYQRVVGVDISPAQLECAEEKAKQLGLQDDVEFVLASASKLPIQHESVDLLTCATAWHWLDPSTVFPEIDRVLKRPGVLAVYGYCTPIVRHYEHCNKIIDSFLSTKCLWEDGGPYGNTREVCESHYKNIMLPYPLVEKHEIEEESVMSLEGIRGMFESLHSYEAYCREHPDNTGLEDMVIAMKKELHNGKMESKLSEVTFTAAIPFFMFLAVKQ